MYYQQLLCQQLQYQQLQYQQLQYQQQWECSGPPWWELPEQRGPLPLLLRVLRGLGISTGPQLPIPLGSAGMLSAVLRPPSVCGRARPPSHPVGQPA
jgi:hypothetical protein